MNTEKDKMLAGELYNPLDPQLSAERARCRDLCRELNETREDEKERRRRVLGQLFGKEADAWIQPPFFAITAQTLSWATRSFSILTAWFSMWHR